MNKSLYETIPSKIIDRYTSKESLAAFSMVKPGQSGNTLKQLSRDLYELNTLFKGHKDIKRMHGFKLMQRVLKEQCHVETEKGLDPKTVLGDTLYGSSDENHEGRHGSKDSYTGKQRPRRLMFTYH